MRFTCLHALCSLLPSLSITAALHAQTTINEEKGLAGVEIQNIRTAMEFFYLDHNRFTTIENLDDNPTSTGNPAYQAINNGGGALVVIPNTGLLDVEFITVDAFDGGPPYLTRSSGTPYEGPSGDYDQGTPLDPWGNPYYFYSPLGLVEPKSESLSLRFYGDEFDFYSIVSHGPDGEPKGGDDFIEQIFVPITTPAISSARLRNDGLKGIAIGELSIKGYNLGASQGAGEILFDGQPSGLSIGVWSQTLITGTMTSYPEVEIQVSVRLNSGAETRSIPFTDERQPLATTNWMNYP